DLDYPWWLAWWKGRLSREDRVKELERLITREFSPVVVDLVDAARNRFTKQVAAASLNAQVICSSIVDALRTQSEWHATKAQELLLVNSGRSGDLMSEHQRNLAELREWLQKWETVSRGLGDVRDRCHLLLGDHSPPPSTDRG